MDISFHYFAVKTLARIAGFSDCEAQRIAEFSQYVDDYTWESPRKCSKIPKYAKLPQYDLVERRRLFGKISKKAGSKGRGGKNARTGLAGLTGSVITAIIKLLKKLPFFGRRINPVRTGFKTWVNFVTIAVNEKEQKFIAAPFHFIPHSKITAEKDTRTTPCVPGDNSLIDTILNQAIEEYARLRGNGEDTKDTLMRIGMLLHTYADTHSHELFSGYNSWVNDVKVTNVTSNIDNTDITANTQAEIAEIERTTKEDIIDDMLEDIAETEYADTKDIIDNMLEEMSETDCEARKDIIEDILEDISEIGHNSYKNRRKNIRALIDSYKNKGNDIYSLIPYFLIGHSKIGHVPDRSDISFIINYKTSKNGKCDKIYKRNNTETFVKAGRHILNYLRKCHGTPDIHDIEWEPLSKLLTKALLFKKPEKNTVNTLAEHWKNIFKNQNMNYDYNEKTIEERFFSINETTADISQTKADPSKYTSDFYRYNCIANETQIELYGEKPRTK